MEDENGPSRASKPCLHIKAETDGRCGTYTYKDPWLEPGYLYVGLIRPDLVWYQDTPEVSISLSQADAVQSMLKGNLNDQVLAPVVLKELPETMTIHRQLLSGGFGAKSFANRFLAYKFGVLPFLGDLKKLLSGHRSIEDHMRFINSKYHQTIKVSRNCGNLTGRSYGSFQWYGDVTTHAKLRVVRVYDAHDRIMQYLDYYGASLVDVLWEILPYSFIVDWFFDMGQILHHLQPSFQRPACQVLDVCTTQKGSSTFMITVADHNGVPQPGPTMSYRYFRRDVGTLGPSSFVGSGLTWARAPIAGALLLQKLL